MKNCIFLLILFLAINSQGQNGFHPTVDKVTVVYKPVSAPGKSGFSVIPEATILLKDSGKPSVIHFAIYKKDSDSLLYKVQYDLSSGPVISAKGKKLFAAEQQQVFISPGSPSRLKPYTFRIQTEDSLHVLSPNYIITQ